MNNQEKSALPSPPLPLSEQFVEWQWLLGEWEGFAEPPIGKSTRITEKINEDEFKIVIKVTGPDGKPMEATTVMKRKGITQQ